MKTVTLLIFLLTSFEGFSQDLAWTHIEHLEDSMSIAPKHILIKIETKWCGYCKMMDAKVFPTKKVTKELNENYYYVKLDAEAKETITFNDTTYKYVLYNGGRGVQTLSQKLASQNGKMQYPTIVKLDENYQVTDLLDGYLNKSNFYYWLKQD
jgi:thioredoxin-related protein